MAGFPPSDPPPPLDLIYQPEHTVPCYSCGEERARVSVQYGADTVQCNFCGATFTRPELWEFALRWQMLLEAMDHRVIDRI